MKNKIILLVVVALHSSSCRAPQDVASKQPSAHDWRLVYKDADYEVSLDSSHVELSSDSSYLVWFQTRHAAPKVEAGKPWNRELIRSLLRCEPLSFKTVRITLHYDAGPVVAAEGGEVADVADKPWKRVISPSVDEAAMREACTVISRRPPP